MSAHHRPRSTLSAMSMNTLPPPVKVAPKQSQLPQQRLPQAGHLTFKPAPHPPPSVRALSQLSDHNSTLPVETLAKTNQHATPSEATLPMLRSINIHPGVQDYQDQGLKEDAGHTGKQDSASNLKPDCTSNLKRPPSLNMHPGSALSTQLCSKRLVSTRKKELTAAHSHGIVSATAVISPQASSFRPRQSTGLVKTTPNTIPPPTSKTVPNSLEKKPSSKRFSYSFQHSCSPTVPSTGPPVLVTLESFPTEPSYNSVGERSQLGLNPRQYSPEHAMQTPKPSQLLSQSPFPHATQALHCHGSSTHGSKVFHDAGLQPISKTDHHHASLRRQFSTGRSTELKSPSYTHPDPTMSNPSMPYFHKHPHRFPAHVPCEPSIESPITALQQSDSSLLSSPYPPSKLSPHCHALHSLDEPLLPHPAATSLLPYPYPSCNNGLRLLHEPTVSFSNSPLTYPTTHSPQHITHSPQHITHSPQHITHSPQRATRTPLTQRTFFQRKLNQLNSTLPSQQAYRPPLHAQSSTFLPNKLYPHPSSSCAESPFKLLSVLPNPLSKERCLTFQDEKIPAQHSQPSHCLQMRDTCSTDHCSGSSQRGNASQPRPFSTNTFTSRRISPARCQHQTLHHFAHPVQSIPQLWNPTRAASPLNAGECSPATNQPSLPRTSEGRTLPSDNALTLPNENALTLPSEKVLSSYKAMSVPSHKPLAPPDGRELHCFPQKTFPLANATVDEGINRIARKIAEHEQRMTGKDKPAARLQSAFQREPAASTPPFPDEGSRLSAVAKPARLEAPLTPDPFAVLDEAPSQIPRRSSLDKAPFEMPRRSSPSHISTFRHSFTCPEQFEHSPIRPPASSSVEAEHSNPRGNAALLQALHTQVHLDTALRNFKSRFFGLSSLLQSQPQATTSTHACSPARTAQPLQHPSFLRQGIAGLPPTQPASHPACSADHKWNKLRRQFAARGREMGLDWVRRTLTPLVDEMDPFLSMSQAKESSAGEVVDAFEEAETHWHQCLLHQWTEQQLLESDIQKDAFGTAGLEEVTAADMARYFNSRFTSNSLGPQGLSQSYFHNRDVLPLLRRVHARCSQPCTLDSKSMSGQPQNLHRYPPPSVWQQPRRPTRSSALQSFHSGLEAVSQAMDQAGSSSGQCFAVKARHLWEVLKK